MKNDERKHDAIEQLVADYLETEAASVDAAALLARAQATQRRRRVWREVRLVFATAALFAVAVGVGLLLTAEPTEPSSHASALYNKLASSGQKMRKGVDALRIGTVPFESALSDLKLPVNGTVAMEVTPNITDLRASWRQDAEHVGGKLRKSLETTLANAGLLL